MATETLELFTCERRTLRLTTKGCSSLYQKANQAKRPDPWLGLATCRGCPVGAMHATGHAPDAFAALQESLKQVCSRCLRDSDRLILRESRGLCASCDARQREAIRGHTAKGNRPAIADLLHNGSIALSEGVGEHLVYRRGILALSEIVVQASKSAKRCTAFGRPRVYWNAMVRAGPHKPWANQLEMAF